MTPTKDQGDPRRDEMTEEQGNALKVLETCARDGNNAVLDAEAGDFLVDEGYATRVKSEQPRGYGEYKLKEDVQ